MTPGRILTAAWRAFGSPIYSQFGPAAGGITSGVGAGGGGGTARFDDVYHSYFGKNRPPNYIFGTYAPSQDWTLWTETPIE